MTAVNAVEVADLPYYSTSERDPLSEQMAEQQISGVSSKATCSQTTDYKIWEISEGGSTVIYWTKKCLHIAEN